ncbi:Nucleotidyltransferase [Balamuthia mandrillaris]
MKEEEKPLRQARLYLDRRNARGRVLMAMVMGSQAYNLAHEGSDYDYMGVFLAPSEELLSLNGPPADCLNHLPGEPEPDITLYEAKRFCQLLLAGNPFMMEIVFANVAEMLRMGTIEFDEGSEWRQIFLDETFQQSLLTQKVVIGYLDYIKSQIKQAKRKKRLKGKRIYHTLRLLWEAERLLKGKRPKVWLREGSRKREELVRIRQEEVEPRSVVERVEERVQRIEAFIAQEEGKRKGQEEAQKQHEEEERMKEAGDAEERKWRWRELPVCTEETVLNEWLVELRTTQFLGDKR